MNVNVNMILMSDIVLRPNRKIDSKKVEALAESIKQVGLINPVTISNDDNVLISGYHRIEACKTLGHETIKCEIITLDPLHKELMQIDENMVKNDLSVLDRCLQLARKKAIYEEMNPDAQTHGGDRKTENRRTDSFVGNTARRSGRSESTIKGEIRIGKSLGTDVVKVIMENGFENKKSILLELSKIKPEHQMAKLNQMLDVTEEIPSEQ